ncbi:MAG: hypothetical protein Q8P31_06240 [Bacillota bacterium]|nr:hypothetical protein [Bacillota bacterium]
MACERGYHVRHVKTPRLLADLGGGHADGTFQQRLRTYLTVELILSSTTLVCRP